MAIQDDWTINYSAKTVTHTSGTMVYGTLAFFQWLAATFAATGQMDDYPIQSDTPTVFKWINGWSFGAPSTDYKFLSGGSIESSDGNDAWANLYSIGSQFRSGFIYLVQNEAEVTPWWSAGNIDILVQVKSGGAWIQSVNEAGVATNGGVWAYSRDSDGLFDHNFVDLSGLGRNPVGINTFEDLNYNDTGDLYLDVDSVTGFDKGNYVTGVTSGATARINYIDGTNGYLYLCMQEGGPFVATETINETLTRGGTSTGTTTTNHATVGEYDAVRGYNDITISFGDISRDLNNGAGSQSYKVEVDCQGRTMKQVYQYLKYVARHNSSTTINSDQGEEYRSALEGTYTDAKQAPFGTFAGGTLFGARGVWFTDYSSATFQLTDATGNLQLPPNYQKVTISHDNLTGCNIFVAKRTGAAVIKDQYTIDSVTANTIVATAAIDINETPQSGVIRVGDTKFTYTSYSGSTFSGVSPDPTGQIGTFYVPLLDVTADATSESSDNIIYDAAIPVKFVVRKYGYKPFSQDTNFTSSGLSASPILTVDPQAT